jgi:F420-non-reducing hydrogenase large subunit
MAKWKCKSGGSLTMTKKSITIDPITRIEGHAKVQLFLDDDDALLDARMDVLEIRGFEKLLENLPMERAPLITSRICGVCPVVHHLASTKAIESALNIEIPETAKKLRKLMLLGQFLHSHGLHFFFLWAPDLFSSSGGSFLNIKKEKPQWIEKAFQLRELGLRIDDCLGLRFVHPIGSKIGGVVKALDSSQLDKLKKAAETALNGFETIFNDVSEKINEKDELFRNFADFPSYFMALDGDNGYSLYDGMLKVMDPSGNICQTEKPENYSDVFEETVNSNSYMKPTYLKKQGLENGLYRVNTLARLNIAESFGTPMADDAFEKFRKTWSRPATGTLLLNVARLIEIIYTLEQISNLLNDDKIISEDISTTVKTKAGEGVGCVEAPRGPLFHHYVINDNGFITKSNLIIATQQNTFAINRSIKLAAEKHLNGGALSDEGANLVESAIRSYDPCLSCATHLIGKRQYAIEVIKDNEIIQEIR